ncbi:zinc finger protein 628-like [Salvelinus namaycush]|uniref:Zinc finger protein 628-like n=1 Tax=Salvelinus namaycush TaxID=8040 RepID=A0A8U0UCP6_SALNM|nr:zinc finger protein 628-like [Salvelinus namaycush]
MTPGKKRHSSTNTNTHTYINTKHTTFYSLIVSCLNMANSALVVQAELLPPQSSSSLSPFPSLQGPGEGEEDRERGEEADGEKGMVEGGEDIVLTGVGVQMVTSSVLAAPHLQEHPEHPFQCLDCGKSFKWSSRLAHHQRSHNNERPYRCNLCPKAFKGSSALLYHQRSHSGEKPYKCEDCDKAFKRSSLLQVHRSVHTGLRTFQCPYCPLTFKWSSHYQYHLRQHTGECPYPCDSCPKAFKNSSSLRRHKNVHLGLKPYVCTVCTKAFTQSTNLRQHMRIHTGERPYICGECGRSFTHSSNLALHRNSQSHTGEGKGGETGGGNMGDEIQEVIVGEDVTSQMLTDMGFVSQEATVGVGVGEVFLSSGHQNLLPHLTLTPTQGGMCTSRAIGTEVHVSTESGASVLLYSCGSCSQTFSTRTELEDHQAMHLGPGEEGGSGVGEGGEGGVGHLLADFEEVVETTTAAAENGHTTAELLGLTGGVDGGNMGTTQAQFDLLQSFTVGAQIPTDSVETGGNTTGTGTECAYCGKSFKTSGGLNRHLAQVHSLSPSQSRSQFSCSACDRSFTLLSSLLTHQHSHTPEQRLLAEAEAEIVCPASLSLSLPLPSSPSQGDQHQDTQGEIHVSLMAVTEEEDREMVKPSTRAVVKGQRRGAASKTAGGNNERPYRCSECGKAFKGSSGLRYHMRDHTGERPYRCTECGKSFKRSSLLSIHQRVHTGVRAFQCPYCPLTFKWSSHYQYHLRQHTGERPYVCQECGKSFKNSSCLRRHSQLHSGLRPHICPICSKSFSQTSNLKQHERTHSGERPFQCAQCHKSFTHSSNLQLHLRTHSSRKDYKCPFCGKEFVMQSYLQRHMRTHGNGAVAGDAGVGGKEGGRAGGGVTTTTTLLNPITLETTGNSGSLIVSQPALDIPPNTSQNYFMIQTANGLQLIPLSAPAPPPPPPPPPQTQYILLQCPSTNGSQPSLILVPTTATNPQPTLEPQGLPLVQTVLNPAQTQMQHFQTISQQQQQPRFIITTNNNNVNNPPVAKTTTPSLNSMLNKPILGKSTRTARSRRGRKPKAAVGRHTITSVATTTTSVTMTTAPVSQSGDVIPVSSCNVTSVTPATVTAANTMTSSLPSSLPAKSQSPFSPPTASVSVSTPSSSTSAAVTSGPLKVATVNSVTTVTPSSLPSDPVAWVGEPQTAPELGKTTEQDMRGEQYVLCFQKEGGKKEEVKIGGEGGGSYVLQFEGEGSGEGGQGGMGREGDGESYALMPLNGQEVVFELGDENKMVGQGSGESLQMIALIQGEGGGEGEGGSYSGAGGAVGEGRGPMDGIFQLEGGEGIVIIEVSTSSLREGGLDRGEGGVTVERSEAKGGSGITEA